MSNGDTWSPDQPLGSETFEQGDEASDEASRVNPGFTEDVEEDPSLDPTLLIDEAELEEIGVDLDDPELLATLDGGMDDPDGSGEPTKHVGDRDDASQGWELDAPLAREGSSDGAEGD
jgi:hypothetical protein